MGFYDEMTIEQKAQHLYHYLDSIMAALPELVTEEEEDELENKAAKLYAAKLFEMCGGDLLEMKEVYSLSLAIARDAYETEKLYKRMNLENN